eukprot:CAMPEP_0194517672 /NCGR_PEP_ID=MMETSP0253-20130528/50906_1 /TAXON_ID=2966 /ORGANISM="Noctiluca scintillans" /LENGTH=508 /DNA_ID=CAMNT_0039361665 /DNA_START=51 /DNA_END=1577 /DNA_ORIENTATION=-
MFRPSLSNNQADTSVREVARAIYQSGREDGIAGVEAVAHVIQNRMEHAGVRGDAQTAARIEADVFARGVRATAPQSPVERELFEHAQSLAAQLVSPPHRLTSMDLTGGALHYDRRDQDRRNPERRGTRSTPAQERTTLPGSNAESLPSVNPFTPVGTATVAEPPFRAVPRSPRPWTPPRPRGPLSFFRQGATRNGEAPSGPSAAPGLSQNAVERGLTVPADNSGASTVRRLPVGSDDEVNRANPSSTAGMAAPTRAMMASGVSAQHSIASAPAPALRWHACSGPSHVVERVGPENLGTGARRLPGDGDREVRRGPSSANGVPPGPMRTAMSSSTPTHPITSALVPPRWHASQGPARQGHRAPQSHDDVDQDFMLQCGLYQDEVIDLMYRDLEPEDFERLCRLDERLPRRTAQRNLVESLPRMQAKATVSTECGVCLADFEPTTQVAQLPCQHAFHPQCIAKWLTQCKNACPLCSAPIEEAQVEQTAGECSSSRSRRKAAHQDRPHSTA